MIKLAWKNLTSKPLSMLLSVLLFALGVGLISLLLILNKQLQEKFDKNLAGVDLVIGAKGSPLQLILSSMYHVDNPTGNIPIKEVRPFLNPKHPLIKTAIPLSGGDSYRGFRIIGTTHEILNLYEGAIGEGKKWEKNLDAVIGASVAEKTGLKVGSRFKSAHGLIDVEELIDMHRDDADFVVTGILKPSGSVLDQLILTNTQSIWYVHDTHDHGDGNHEEHDHAHEGHDHNHDHDGHHHPPVEPTKALRDEIDKDITALLIKFKGRNAQTLNMPRSINENTDLLAASPAYELNRLYDLMGSGELLLRYIAFIIIIVSGLSIFIALYNSLKERRYELALMRVMGASRAKLFFLIILEGILLAIIGYILGIVLSHIAMSLLAGYMESSYRYTFSGWIFLKEEIYLLIAALGIGFLAAILPAFQAFKTDISTTLSRN